MKVHHISCAALLALTPAMGWAFQPNQDQSDDPAESSAPAEQEQSEESKPDFGDASAKLQAQLAAAIEELATIKQQMADEQIPLTKELNGLESELSTLRADYQQTVSLLDSRSLDLNNLGDEIQTREDEVAWLASNIGDYVRKFKNRLHMAEKQRYVDVLDEATSAAENTSMGDSELFAIQAKVIEASLARLEESLGGAQFDGTALSEGYQKEGRMLLLGPVALFRSTDGQQVGMAEERLGSLEPNLIPYGLEEDKAAAGALVSNGRGLLPLDASLGNAYKIEGTKETLLEHIKKGGAVMYPILGMAAAALLVALVKWLSLLFVRTPSRKRLQVLLTAVEKNDEDGARDALSKIKGHVGKMLEVGVDHLGEPRDLIEESMYERVLSSKLRLNSFLPFIAICAASAPLMGLLGTVTGIIDTFKMITVFGSGDVKSLSGGISTALITTEFGLIVAIPSLILHAFLSRKARGVVDDMEKAGVAFANSVERSTLNQRRAAGYSDADSDQSGAAPAQAPGDADVRAKVTEVLGEMLSPQVQERIGGSSPS